MVYLMLGCNEGNCLQNLREALAHISNLVGRVEKVSSVYVTAPWGSRFCDQKPFMNQAVALSTRLSPRQLLDSLLSIEKQMGRDRELAVLGRSIDIDLLLYEDVAIDQHGLCVPHPRMALRRFVLVPLAEIAPHALHPIFHQSIASLLDACTDPLSVTLQEASSLVQSN